MAFLPFDDDDEKRRRALTPGINPNAPTLPNITPRRPVPLPPPAPTPSDLPDLPMMRENIPIPGMAHAPSLAGLRSSPPSLGPRPSPRMAAPAAAPPVPTPPPPTMDMSEVGVPIPSLSGRGGPAPYSPMAKAEYDYVREGQRDAAGNPTGKYRRSKGDIAKSALVGFLQGVGGGGGLAGGLGGALAGGGMTAVNPRLGREYLFEQTVRPKLERERAERMDAVSQARQAAADALNAEYKHAQIGEIGSQNEARAAQTALAGRKQDLEENQPFNVPEGSTAINRKTGQPVFTSPRVKQPTQSEANADIERRFYEATGETVESQSRKSLAGRLGSLKGRLTSDEQRLVFGRATADDDSKTIARAQAKWQKIQDDELKSIQRDTLARVRAQYGGSQRSGSAGQSGQSQRKGQPGRTAISVKEAADLLK